jgi:RND family efflux transporter MFP subunit
MKKIFITVVVLGIIGILGWQIYEKASPSRKGAKRGRTKPPVVVEIAPIQKTTIREVGRFTGSLYPVAEFIVAPKIAGRLEKITVDIGDLVSGGQLVAVLDDAETHQMVGEAAAELEVARANIQERENVLVKSLREYERTVALRQKKIASASQLDETESEYKTQQAKLSVAKAQLAQKEAALKMAKVRLSYTKIRVPENHAAGHRVVGERYVDEGAMLPANQPIVSVLDIATLIAAIHVIERDYSKIKIGLASTVTTDAFPGRTFTGRVIRIAPLLKEKSREARVEIKIPNTEKLLKPGMFVRVNIQFDQHDNATLVPTDALVKRKGAQGVFLADMEKKEARFVPVSVGIVDGAMAEVIDPPITGAVVTLGHHLLEDGGAIVLPSALPDVRSSSPLVKIKEDKTTGNGEKPGPRHGKVPPDRGNS